MVELPVSQFIPVQQVMKKMEHFVIRRARLATIQSGLYAGKVVHLVGPIKERFAESVLISMAKDAAVQFSVVVIIAEAVILMMVALAEDLLKL